MTIAYVVAGALLIVAGRRIFWLFLGLLCFVAGLSTLQRWFPEVSQSTLLLGALAIGALGAGIGAMAQKIAVWIGGFFGGGLLALLLVHMTTESSGSTPLVAFLVGGVIGILLAHFLFKWVMIVVSSAIGALVIGNVLEIGMGLGSIVFVVLLVVGIVIQGGLLWHRKSGSGNSGSRSDGASQSSGA